MLMLPLADDGYDFGSLFTRTMPGGRARAFFGSAGTSKKTKNVILAEE